MYVASFYTLAGWFESYLFANPEGRFSHHVAQMSHVMRLWYFLSSSNAHVQPSSGAWGLIFDPFIFFHTSWVWTLKALARLRRCAWRDCAGSPDSALVPCVISIIISRAGSNDDWKRKLPRTVPLNSFYRQEDMNPSWLFDVDRKILPEGHCLASRGLHFFFSYLFFFIIFTVIAHEFIDYVLYFKASIYWNLSQLMSLWYLSHRQPAKAQVSLRICTVSPEPSLFADIKYGSWQRVQLKNQTSGLTGWLRMRVWRMSLRRMKSAIIAWAGSFMANFSVSHLFSHIELQCLKDVNLTNFCTDLLWQFQVFFNQLTCICWESHKLDTGKQCWHILLIRLYTFHHSVCIFYSQVKSQSSYFRIITATFLGVRIFTVSYLFISRLGIFIVIYNFKCYL